MFPPLPSVSISLRLWLLALFNSVPLSSVTAVFFLRVHPLNSSVSASCELWVGELSQRSLVNSCCLHPCALLLLRLYLSPSVTLKDLSLPQFTPNHRRTHTTHSRSQVTKCFTASPQILLGRHNMDHISKTNLVAKSWTLGFKVKPQDHVHHVLC